VVAERASGPPANVSGRWRLSDRQPASAKSIRTVIDAIAVTLRGEASGSTGETTGRANTTQREPLFEQALKIYPNEAEALAGRLRLMRAVGYELIDVTRAALLDGTLTFLIAHPLERLADETIAGMLRAVSSAGRIGRMVHSPSCFRSRSSRARTCEKFACPFLACGDFVFIPAQNLVLFATNGVNLISYSAIPESGGQPEAPAPAGHGDLAKHKAGY
jgi:hypothetical protein